MMHPVVMLCHNGVELTKRAVASVLEQDVMTRLFVVDNNSQDGTAEYLASLDPAKVFTWTCKPALGVSASWNFALTSVFRTWEHCLVLNNDIQLRPDTLRELVVDGGGFVTAVSVDNPAGIRGTFVKSVRPHPDFSAFLIRREVWKKVGAFDEDMKHYCSDGDYHVRMHQAGITAYTIGIPFYHYASGTLKNAPEYERREIEQQADKDRDTFARKWGVRMGSDDYYKLFGTERPANG